jgi:dihydrofolate reductase
MNIAIIAAIGMERELGKENTLLWNLPSDMRYFRKMTNGHTVIMGRKTYESIGKALPGRNNIVITKDTTYTTGDTDVVHSIDEAIELAKKISVHDDIYIIGGAQIYTQAIPYVERLYITQVDATFPMADTFFPAIDPHLFAEVSREKHTKDDQHAYDYDFVVYKKL